jgi:hypothetical protein
MTQGFWRLARASEAHIRMDLQRASNAASRQKNQSACHLNLFPPAKSSLKVARLQLEE